MNAGAIVIKVAMVGAIILLAVPTVQLLVNTDIHSSDDSISDNAVTYQWFNTLDGYEMSPSVSEYVFTRGTIWISKVRRKCWNTLGLCTSRRSSSQRPRTPEM